MCEGMKGYKHKHKHGKEELGETKFVKDQFEEGVEKKIGKTPSTSLWKVHKGRK